MVVDLNILYGILIVVGMSALMIYAVPKLKEKNIDYYEQIKLALLLCNYAFRNDKVKLIADIVLDIVTSMENMSTSSEIKHDLVIKEVSKHLLEDLNISLDEQALDLMVKVAVALLPPTKPVV